MRQYGSGRGTGKDPVLEHVSGPKHVSGLEHVPRLEHVAGLDPAPGFEHVPRDDFWRMLFCRI